MIEKSNIHVSSNNGQIHIAEYAAMTTKKTPKEYPGFVRKLCDGQWVSEKKKIEAEITCPRCLKGT